MTRIHGYHAHVYFDVDSKDSAERLRAAIADEWDGRVRVHGLIDAAIGPHPLPMFEVDVPVPAIDEVLAWLEHHHGSHSILIHPITGDDLIDHRDNARWIGQPLPLNLAFLEKLKNH